MDDEIDLRPYIERLLRSWQWIAGFSFVAALFAFLITLVLPKTYEATASVAIVRSRTDINFDPRIVDITADEFLRTDTSARRQALVALVTNNDVALSVVEELGGTLSDQLRSVDALLKMVEAANEGDLIIINVRAEEPEIAAAVANSWSKHYESLVNNLYGVTGNADMESLSVQLQSAADSYGLAQEQVETFISNNQIVSLEGEIAAQQMLLDAYHAAQVAVQVEPVKLQTDTNQKVLAGYYTLLLETELLLADAEVLRDLLMSGGGSTGADLGNVLALIALQNRVFSKDINIDIQVDVSAGAEEPLQLSDVEAIIAVLENRQLTLLSQIEAVTAAWVNEFPHEIVLPDDHLLNVSVVRLEQEIKLLEASLESEKAEQRELQQTRDHAWETYQTLALKMTEGEIAAQTTGTEVRLAQQAVPLYEPTNVSKLFLLVLAVVSGTLFSVLILLIHEWWLQSFSRAEGAPGEGDL